MFSHRTNEDGLGVIPKSLSRIEFESGPHVYSFDLDRLAGQCLLQIELNTFTLIRSDLFVKPQEFVENLSSLSMRLFRFSSASSRTAIRMRCSAWVTAASLSSGSTICFHPLFLEHRPLIMHPCVKVRHSAFQRFGYFSNQTGQLFHHALVTQRSPDPCLLRLASVGTFCFSISMLALFEALPAASSAQRNLISMFSCPFRPLVYFRGRRQGPRQPAYLLLQDL